MTVASAARYLAFAAVLAFPPLTSAQLPAQGEGTLVANPHREFVRQYDGTKTCLQCHETQAKHAFGSIHYQWKALAPNLVNSYNQKIGKINSTNDFCTNPSFQWIAILTNDQGKVIGNGCSKCHTGLGLKPSETMSREQLENIDCLLCHASNYRREVVKRDDGSLRWMPAARDNPELLANIAQGVSKPTNLNCLACHVGSGGGLNFKRGDLETAHLNPTRDFDVHMGSGMQCIQCHKFREHRVEGAGTQMSGMDWPSNADRPGCESCHRSAPHASAALNRHTKAVYCTTCHIPSFAKKDPTDMRRDWSQAEEVKGEGRFEPKIEHRKDVQPVYAWWTGRGSIALLDVPIKPGGNGKVAMYRPEGTIDDHRARIYAFKYHTGKVPIDAQSKVMIPVQVGATFRSGNTTASAVNGAKAFLGKELRPSDIAYVEVERYMGLFHEVVPKEKALACAECHGAGATRLDWKALGYAGDPMSTGGRKLVPVKAPLRKVATH
jgi:Cytochrome c bacterial